MHVRRNPAESDEFLARKGGIRDVWAGKAFVSFAAGDGESIEVIRDVSEAFETELVAFHAMVTERVAPPTGSEQGHADTLTGQRLTRALAANLGIELSGEVGRLPATPE